MSWWIRNKNNELRRKRELFEVTKEDVQKSGFREPTFNYFSNKRYRKFIFDLTEYALAVDISEKEFYELWRDRTGLYIPEIKKILEGERAIELWEYITICNAVGLKINLEQTDFVKYTSRLEESTLGAKIIIESKGFVSFVLIMNPDDYYDFHIRFTKKQITKTGENRYLYAVIDALRWYFIEEAGNEDLPFDTRIFKRVFRAKWHMFEFMNIQPIDQSKEIDLEQLKK